MGSSGSGTGKTKKEPKKWKKYAIIGSIALASAITINGVHNMMTFPDPWGDASKIVENIADEFALNASDIQDPTRAGRYANNMEDVLEEVIKQGMIHRGDVIFSDKNAMQIAKKGGVTIAFDDQITEYGAIFHPEEKIIAVNANVEPAQAAIYIRNALHHYSFIYMHDVEKERTAKLKGEEWEGPHLLEGAFAVDLHNTDSVQLSIHRGSEFEKDFKPPSPPVKRGPAVGS